MNKDFLPRCMCGLVVLAFCQSALFGMYARFSDLELVETSQVIVRGTYLGEERIDFGWGQSVLVGRIEVESVLKGEGELAIVYLQVKEAEVRRSSEDIVYEPGSKGLWFLAAIDDKPDLYAANHPQRFVPSSNRDLVKSLEDAIDAVRD